jgi:hypothetical protein
MGRSPKPSTPRLAQGTKELKVLIQNFMQEKISPSSGAWLELIVRQGLLRDL